MIADLEYIQKNYIVVHGHHRIVRVTTGTLWKEIVTPQPEKINVFRFNPCGKWVITHQSVELGDKIHYLEGMDIVQYMIYDGWYSTNPGHPEPQYQFPTDQKIQAFNTRILLNGEDVTGELRSATYDDLVLASHSDGAGRDYTLKGEFEELPLEKTGMKQLQPKQAEQSNTDPARRLSR